MADKSSTGSDGAEQRIFDAAHVEFLQKGFDGAKMQDIADKAGINKALLHYYYRSKDKLYQMVAKAILSRSVPRLRGIIEGPLPLEEKIPGFVHQYISIIAENHYLPLFIISEMNKHPDRFFDEILPKELPKPNVFYAQVEAAVKAGTIRPIDPRHLLVNMMALCIFPFVAKPMIRMVLAMSAPEWEQFISERKLEVSSFVLHAIKTP
jgi:TetR/AcrR family transcriptional regulator